MAKRTRIKVGLYTAFCLVLIAAAYLIARPSILNERAIRTAMTDNLAAWTGAQVTIRGPVRVSYFPRLLVETGELRIKGVTRLPAIKSVAASKVRVRLGLWSFLSGTPVVDRVTLVEPRFEAQAAATGTVSAADSAAPKIIHALASAPFDEFELENGTLIVTGGKSAESFTGLDVRINLEPADGAHLVRGDFTWRDQPLSFRFEGGTPERAANAVKIPVILSLSGELASAEISGHASVANAVRFDGRMDLKLPNLPRFARWTGVLVPEDEKRGNFAANGTFHWTGHTIGFDEGTFVLDGNRALGALALDFAGPRPQIDGTLALQRLSLTQYFEPAVKPPMPPAAPGNTGTVKRVDLDFPILHHINFDLRISTTELVAGPLRLGQSALSVKLEAGRLAADIALFDVCGGNGNGRLELDATVPESAIRLNASMTGISAQTCVGLFTPASPLEGTANVSADISSKGRTADEILEGLRGKARVSVGPGRAGVDLTRLLTAVRTGPVTGWAAAMGNPTAFQSLQGEVFFRHNGIYTDSLAADLGKSRAAGEGTVDLVGEKLDVRLAVASVATPAGAARAQTSEPAQADRIVIKGPWSDPTFSLGPASAESARPSRHMRAAGRDNF